MLDQILDDALKRFLVSDGVVLPLQPGVENLVRRRRQPVQLLHVILELIVEKIQKGGLGGGAQHLRRSQI